MAELIRNIIVGLCSMIGTVIAIKGSVLLSKNDVKEKKDKDKAQIIAETKSNTTLETKMDNVLKGIDDIKLDNRDQCRQLNAMAERVTRVEESTKSAHKRIDELEK